MISGVDKIFLVFGMCFLLEQIFYRILGSYPYRYGFTVKTSLIENFAVDFWESIKDNRKKLDIKTHSDKSEVYIKYKYPALVVGPLLFIGQIKTNNSNGLLHIRIGPISALFVLFLIIYPLVASEVVMAQSYQLLDVIIVVCLVVYFYFRLLRPINTAILQGKSRA